MEKKSKKTKILVYTDSPACSSGFAQVARNILKHLHESGKYEITVFGIAHHTERDEYGRFISHKYPYEILQANFLTSEEVSKGYSQDVYGRQKLMKYLYENEFDIFFSIQDPYVVEEVVVGLDRLRKEGRKFRSIFYFPVDVENQNPKWFNIAYGFDYPVPYSKFAVEEIKKAVKPEFVDKFLEPIPHGVDTKTFYPLENKDIIKKRLFGNKFVCVNVNRNQPRKDPFRSLQVFAEFKKECPNSIYYFHCNPNDVGGNLRNPLKFLGLKEGFDVVFSSDLEKNLGKGASLEKMNQIYNCADLVFSTTLGEGWGLSTSEAMACGVPVVMPNNTTAPEILDNGKRGYLAKSGGNPNLYKFGKNTDDPARPVVDIPDMVAAMVQIYRAKNGDEKQLESLNKRIKNAKQYIESHSWEKICKEKWLPVFEKSTEELKIDKKIL